MATPLRVLIVEDNAADVDLVRDALAEAAPAAFHIESVTRLSSALAHLESKGCDVVLLDLGLPDSQGLETLQKLRQTVPGVPVIVLTGTDAEEIGVAAVTSGAQDYLVKGEVTTRAIARSARHAVERARAEGRERLARDALDLLNRPQGEEDTIHAIIALVKREMDLDAVAIRLRSGDDFPYYATDGFPDSFIEAEQSLAARDETGETVRDESGAPVLACACGIVLSGRAHSPRPFFTAAGSFWTNNAADLLASRNGQRPEHARDRCVREGYQSVALIPLRSGRDVVGLLQLNDRRRDRFSASMVSFFEGLGSSVGIALARKQARRALEESEAKYRELVENLNDVIYAVDLNGTITYASSPTAEVMGYSPEDLIGRPFREIIHPDDIPGLDRRFREILQNRIEPWEFRYRTKDGRLRWARTSSRPVLEGGRPVGISGLLSDVTDRKRAEEGVRQSEARLEEAQRTAHVGSWETNLLTADVVWSDELCRLFEMAPEVVREGRDQVQTALLERIHPDDRATYEDAIANSVSHNARYDIEYRIGLSDGSQRYLHAQGGPTLDSVGNVVRLSGTVADITRRRQAELARERLLERQIVLNRVTLSLGQVTALPAILRTLHDEVRTLLDADGFFISRYAKETGLITALFAIDEGRELDVSTFPPIPLAPEGRGMQSTVLRTGKPLNVPDWLEGEHRMQTVHHIGPDGTFTPPPPETERDDCTKSALLAPLLFRGEPIGVLQLQSNQANAYTNEDADLLAGLANVAAIAIQNALLIEEAERAAEALQRSLEGTLIAVSRASEARDPYTAGHQRRVTDLALAIARELELSDDERETLHAAGLTHDIGKLAIPAEILSKPGVLSPIEFDLIREHPKKAYEILIDVPFPGPVADTVLQHHERLDGSGYPRGLKGEDILREARVLAVADVVEAMASHRPYRAARGLTAALAEIERNAGRLYDPEAADACIRIFRDKGYTLPN